MSTLNKLLAANIYDFPDPKISDPCGYGWVAQGADLAPATLIAAYSQGLFPWFNKNEPITWWCPQPRCVINPASYQPSKSLKRAAKRTHWQLTVNQVFDEVIHACSLPRSYADDTWIHQDMIRAYTKLHQQGFAHSVEVWQMPQQNPADGTDIKFKQIDNLPVQNTDDTIDDVCVPILIGGLYGLKIGGIFFGESMFHRQTDASKITFWGLMRLCQTCDMPLVDCQLPNPHLLSLGAHTITRQDFLTTLATLIEQPTADWQASQHWQITTQKLFDGQTWQCD